MQHVEIMMQITESLGLYFIVQLRSNESLSIM